MEHEEDNNYTEQVENNEQEHNNVSVVENNNVDSSNIIIEDQPSEAEINQNVRRSSRETKLPLYYDKDKINLHTTTQNTEDYNPEVDTVIARIMYHFQECNDNIGMKFHQFVQSYSIKQGIKKFGKRGTEAAYKEVKQLHERIVFEPAKIESLT